MMTSPLKSIGPFVDDARGLTRACVRMHIPPHGLAPEITKFDGNRTYLIRPETLESLYLMWCTEGDDAYGESSWTVFEKLEGAARVDFGYASIKDVTQNKLEHIDRMPSQFLAETVKYAWLSANEIDVTTKYTLTTKAHLVRRVQTPTQQ